MKLRFLSVLFLASLAYLVLSSRTTGAGANGLGDRTGSPVSGGATCANCHSGGSFSPITTIRLLNGGTPVTSYRPGQSYMIEVVVAKQIGTPVGYGFQAVALAAGNSNAGNMASTVTTNTQITNISGRQYAEHNGIQAAGVFRVNWTAPTSGTGNVTIYGIGLAVNGVGGSAGDQASSPANLVITEDNTSIAYSQSTYCQNGTNPSPTQTGTTGGSYSASPAGLNINTSTGLINLAASTVGNYVVTYSYSGGTVTTNVNIAATDVATVSYGNTPSFCSNSSTSVNPTITGSTGGTFSATPSGLAINSSTGVINPAGSTVGNYQVNYTTAGPCPTTVSTNVSIIQSDNPSFNYSSNALCKGSSSTISPNITGTTGGTFTSSPAGLSISSSTGVIDINASSSNTYTVTYTTTGTCPASSSVTITVSDQATASISYSSGNSYCLNVGGTFAPTISGTSGGTFTSSPAGLSINASSGVINPSSSTAGNYQVSYTTPGPCPTTVSENISIIQSDNANFTYGSSSFCQTGGNASATINGTTGGVFSSSPAGLSINTSSGLIDVTLSNPGPYQVTYTTNGVCPASSSINLNITASGDASFSYLSNTICNTASSNPTPNITGISGGTFTSSPAGLNFVNSIGTINLNTSTIGNYTIYYSVAGSCAATDSVQISLVQGDIASISYANSNYCQTATNPVSVINGTQGGVFSSTPAGLNFVSTATGELNLTTSAVGCYTIQYTTSGNCPTTTNTNLCIVANDQATLSYSNTLYCNSAAPQSPTITGAAGSFSAGTGLAINPTTGVIDIANSNLGNYVIQYNTSGTCPITLNWNLEIQICGAIASSSPKSEIKLFPNPSFDGQLNLVYEAIKISEPVSVRIYNGLGQLVSIQSFIPNTSSGKIQLDLASSLGKGIYVLEIRQDTLQKVLRFEMR